MNCIPDNSKIDAKVFMDEHVTEILDFPPWHIRVFGLDVFRQFAYGFADDFEFPDGSRVPHPIICEALEFDTLYV